MRRAYLLSGSNIDPVKNTLLALHMLKEELIICSLSYPWETQAVGSEGPNFLNLAIGVKTDLDLDQLKNDVLAKIEKQLGRTRTADKNAPRTIDLDIIIFDGVIIDDGIWKKAFIAAPMAELLPDLRNPATEKTLCEIANQLLLETATAKQMPALAHFFSNQCDE